MKKVTAFILAVIVALFLCSCSQLGESFSKPRPSLGLVADEKYDPAGELTPLEEIPPAHYFRPAFDAAASAKLKGDLTVLCAFISDGESSWTKRSSEKFLKDAVYPAAEFLEKQADSYGVQLSLEIQSLNISTEELILESDEWDYYSQVNALCKAMDYSDEKAMEEQIINDCGKNTAVLFIVNKPGRSYVYSDYHYTLRDTYDSLFEHGIIFECREAVLADQLLSHLYDDKAGTVAHEILHLYGAEDYYEPEQKASIAKKVCPNDIMLQQTSLKESSVSSLTAFCVGWTDEIPQIFLYDEWWTEEEKAEMNIFKFREDARQ